LRILVLGGTKFLGRAVVEAAVPRGHDLTLFNRGQSNPDLFPDVERLRGDRAGDLAALSGREWDAIVDTSGYIPRTVRASAELLRDRAQHYTFVSSISVYSSFAEAVTEDSPVAQLDGASVDELTADYSNYGALKALCEEEVERAFGARSLNVRAGLIVGPHDPTGRFTYWPHRIVRGGEVLAPGDPDRLVQLIDVRDLAAWIVHAAETGVTGRFNAVSPPGPQSALLEACARGTGGAPTFTYVDEDWLVAREVGQWMELPLWVYTSEPGAGRMLEADASRAIAAGLTFRPLEETSRVTLQEAELVDGVGLAPAREAELLEEWHAA
jgi:nucleoside-diphosphate-sugar epimerase